MKQMPKIAWSALMVAMLAIILLSEGCSSARQHTYGCSSFSGKGNNRHGVSPRQMRKLTTSPKDHFSKQVKVKQSPSKGKALTTLQPEHTSGFRQGVVEVPALVSISFSEKMNGSNQESKNATIAPMKVENREIASSNRNMALSIANKRSLLKVVRTFFREPADHLNGEAVYPAGNPQPEDRSNLAALLSIIFSGSGFLFLLASILLGYPTIALILTVGVYLLAAAGIVFGVIGIYKAITKKKKFLGLAIAGSVIGFLLLITLIVAALL
ncbi:MAG: hypothetical protein WCL00_02845 [Bacteroidota bacterium]